MNHNQYIKGFHGITDDLIRQTKYKLVIYCRPPSPLTECDSLSAETTLFGDDSLLLHQDEKDDRLSMSRISYTGLMSVVPAQLYAYG